MKRHTRSKTASLLLLLSLTTSASAEEIRLWPVGKAPLADGVAGAKLPGPEKVEVRTEYGVTDRWITGTRTALISAHLPPAEMRSGAAVVVCPGGGYFGLSFDKEGEYVSEWLAERGVAAFTLKYRHGGGAHQHPVPQRDVQRALRLVRSRATEWNLKLDRIGVMGFSAGGHVASTAGTHHDQGNSKSSDPIERQSCRPDFLVLIYPVISMQSEITHAGSQRNLLGDSPDSELVNLLSNERHVNKHTPPTFLAHAADDPVVPIENSLRFYRALLKHGVPVELHAYDKGGHGFGMLERRLPIDYWPAALEAWLESRGLIR